MADSNFRGPLSSMGSLEDSNFTTGTTALVPISPFDGPSISYQGVSIPDIRSVPFAKDGTSPARVPSVMMGWDIVAVDNVPQKASTTLLAAAQTATAVTAFALVTAQLAAGASTAAAFAIGVPIIPAGTTVATTANIALDFGFATGTTTANSTTVAVVDNSLFTLGQWIVIGGVGNSSAGVSLITQVTAISTSNTTTINVANVAATGISSVPIGAANLFGSGLLPPATQFGPSAPVANAHSSRTAGGLARLMNPREMVARNVSISVGTTSATTTVVVTGWDVWGNPMVEDIQIIVANRAAASTFFGKKAFKFIQSVVPTTTDNHLFSIGVGDVFGFPFRADYWDQTALTWNGCTVPTSLGFSAASTVNPTTNTAGDVRGTIQVSTNGTGSAASVATAQVSNDAARLCIIQNPGLWNQVYATPNNTVPLFGIGQATSSA